MVVEPSQKVFNDMMSKVNVLESYTGGKVIHVLLYPIFNEDFANTNTSVTIWVVHHGGALLKWTDGWASFLQQSLSLSLLSIFFVRYFFLQENKGF